MGGDHGPGVVVPAALDFVRSDAECRLILVGREDVIRQHLPKGEMPERISLQHATQEVAMDELPSHALRRKKNSSMRVAIDLVKQKGADACVSAGNTGALMATARFVLKTLQHVDRPAIITALPAISGRTWVLDLGANVDSEAEHLYQFKFVVDRVEDCHEVERYLAELPEIDRSRVMLMPQGTDAIALAEKAKWLEPYCARHGLRFCPRRQIEWFGLARGQ